MRIERAALARILRQLAPTLGEKTLLEQLKCFWFDAKNKRAWSYDELVATEIRFEGELNCGLGSQFYGIIDNSSAKDVDLTLTGNELSFALGGSKGQLSVRGMDEAIYPFPADDIKLRKTIVELTGAAEAALRHVNANAKTSGVTIVPEGEYLAFYATSGVSISWARIPLPDEYDAPRLVLSPQFCQRLQATMEGSSATLEIFDDSVIAVLESNIRIFGRITFEESPLPFRQAVETAVPMDNLLVLPEGVVEAIKRIRVMVEPGKFPKMHVTLGGDDAHFEFKSAYGKLDEHFVVKDNKQNIDTHFNPEMLSEGFGMMTPTKISITGAAFALLSDKDFGYVTQATR